MLIKYLKINSCLEYFLFMSNRLDVSWPNLILKILENVDCLKPNFNVFLFKMLVNYPKKLKSTLYYDLYDRYFFLEFS